MNEIGIMQGRLSPPHPDRLQAFPWSSWRDEFGRAASCGFDFIEWQFEADHYVDNPVWTTEGREEIQRQIGSAGIPVRSVCADYFMPHPFFRVSEKERDDSVSVLKTLIVRASEIGVDTILVPILETAEIRTDTERCRLLDALREPLSVAETRGVRLGMETELPRDEYLGLIEQGDNASLGVYYDVGNAGARGYDTAEDIRTLARRLFGVHVKDRKAGGPTVPLGEGDTKFDGFFHALAEIRYEGRFVLQTAFGAGYLGIARKHLDFVRDHITRACADVGSREVRCG